jgi:chloramphenicol 3-O phosphotransferase
VAKGSIIFLNGTSSSGKTSLARLLQAKLARPAYHLSQDIFAQMASQAHRAADFWAVTNTTILAMHHTIALFSDLGLDVIVDHVILDTSA